MPNRLAFEDSPYLQQHKNNAFDWYPWCDEAFKKAKNENKPIFISIGYSSCHWCHVMEREVFKNETIAAFVNENFVCIKVDREERPDIDKHYQEVHQLLNRRSGGWPLSVFCTPQNKPFYVKTYIPPYNQEQMMGFSELTAIIAQKVADKDQKLFQNADEIGSFLYPQNKPVQATALDLKIASLFLKQAQYNFDSENGGFSSEPKFLHVSTLETLMCLDRLNPSETARHIVIHTLQQMSLGGIYDLIDGGFCRYSTDASWLVPHFEKMGYDNALSCSLYAKAALAYNNESFALIAKDIAGFMMKFMMEKDLFYGASDADSNGEKGKYFVFSYDEILTALRNAGLDNQELEEAVSVVGASPNGNFDGNTIIRLLSHNRPQWFETFRISLQSIRSKRTYPFIDTKVITAWNAMMIRALFVLGKIDHSYTETAIRSLDALLSMMLRNDKLFHSGLLHKEPKIEAFLEDYAYLCSALLEAYEATLDETYLVWAQQIANKALELYYNQGSWYFSRGDFTTCAELDDGTYPSALAVMVESLLILGQLIDEKYRRFAFKTLEYHSIKLMKTPIFYSKFVEQVLRFLNPVRIIKVPQQLCAKRPAFINYPFALYSAEYSGEEFMICDETSCFVQTQNPSLLDDLIKSSI